MARPVLRLTCSNATGFIFALSCFAAVASGLPGQTRQCVPGELANGTESYQKQSRDLQQRVTVGPFYKELLRKFGSPKSCNAKLDGETITLSYAFRNHAHLEARASSSIEYSQQRVDFRGLNTEQAKALLRAAESDSFGLSGCGMDWDKPETDSTGKQPGSHAVVFRGDSCNCQGRVLYEGNSVVALILSNSC